MMMMMQGQRRRSPRISALDTSNQKQIINTTTSTTTTTFDEPNLPPLSKLPRQVWKGRDSPENADCGKDTDTCTLVEWRSLKENKRDDDDDDDAITNGKAKATAMPAKHILELVLDTLQRRDTYEIFAQPVDPDEVEDYYEIIKESMDFGTMRAKLHEGMYQNLQQFEHDVFLIPENAMHFNSSATTYFRQARAIHDLAIKVFHVLKTNPQNFVSEFSGTRRRSMRKAFTRTKDSSIPKSVPSPSTSRFRRSNKKTTPARNVGSRDCRLSNSQAVDRRDTYSCKKEDRTVYSTCDSSCKPLILGDINYEDSLMCHSPKVTLTSTKKVHRNPCAPVVRDLNCSSRPVILALENYHSNVAEFKSRKRSCIVPSRSVSVSVRDEAAKQQQPPLPLISSFTFDLPFLKARLDRMKAVENSKGGLSIT
ncbi:DNA-binding bromodomain-containing protein [Perilla frutescens var. frutescens]|nr:DNA-binding bromodomain-containing protein [Perilla frutescens var. frutescens]